MDRIQQLGMFIEVLNDIIPDLEEQAFYQTKEGNKHIQILQELKMDLEMEQKVLEKEEQ